MKVSPVNTMRLGWATWAACTFIAYAWLVLPAEARMRDIAFHTHALYDLANRTERLRTSASQIEAARLDVRHDLQELASDASSGRAALTALREFQQMASSERLTIVRLSRTPSAGTNAAGNDQLNAAIRGRYADVVASIASISRGSPLIRVDAAELEPTTLEDRHHLVAASLTLTLYHGLDAITKGNRNATNAANGAP